MALYSVSGANAQPVERTSLAQEHLFEVQHLEKWIATHPEILGDGVMVITTQFDRWATSGGESAAERLDVLGLDSSGQLVVVELKRAGDRKVHLQAITYAALVSSFTQDQLAQAHQSYLRSQGDAEVTEAQALERLRDHVDDEWDPDIIKQPRIVLVAEKFPAQVLTTARWLTEVSSGALVVECHELALYRIQSSHGEPELCADFRMIWPVADMEDRMLLPRFEEAKDTQAKVVERKRRARTAATLANAKAIPVGARIDLHLDGWVSAESVQSVTQWLDKDPARREVFWTGDPNKSLRWALAPEATYSLSRLAKRIIANATDGNDPKTIAGGDVWRYGGTPLSSIARAIEASEE